MVTISICCFGYLEEFEIQFVRVQTQRLRNIGSKEVSKAYMPEGKEGGGGEVVFTQHTLVIADVKSVNNDGSLQQVQSNYCGTPHPRLRNVERR